MVLDIIVGLFQAAVRIATPYLLASLGETIDQNSGVLNLGVEGIMLLGAFAGFAGASFTGNIFLGLFFGIFFGGLAGLLMAFLSVTLRTDQTITGVVIVILLEGLVAYLLRIIFGTSVLPSLHWLETIEIPILSQVPIIGPILFKQNPLTYFAIILAFVLWFILFKTNFGLKIRAVGENPKAADTFGVDVFKIRYLCVIFGGAIGGLAGCALSLTYVKFFAEWMIGGRGWIAVSLVILGRWNPIKVLAASLLFGGADALQMRLQSYLGLQFPYQMFLVIPYILAIVTLVIVSRRRGGPSSLAIPYSRED